MNRFRVNLNWNWFGFCVISCLAVFRFDTHHTNFSTIFFFNPTKSDAIFQLRNISFKIFHLHSFLVFLFMWIFSFLIQHCYILFTYTFAKEKINFPQLSWDFCLGTSNKQFLFYHIFYLSQIDYYSEKHKTLSKH